MDPDDPGRHLSKNSRKALAKIRNRLAERGLEPEFRWTCDADEVAAQLPDLVRMHRERDLALGRRPDHNDPVAATFYHEVIRRHARAGEVDLLTLHLEGDLAAFVCGFRDGRTFRSWDNRLAPRWAEASAGRLANFEALRHVVQDQQYDALDWMRGEEPYKLQSATEVVPTVVLRAWSTPVLRATDALAEQAVDGECSLLHSSLALRQARERVRARAPGPRARARPEVTGALVPAGAEVADLVDRLLQRPALVVGSLPPYGRDLDVLVDDLDAEPLARGLRSAGFTGSGGVWRHGMGSNGRLQDVTTAAEWDLPAEELHWLRDGAGVLPPWGCLRQPALAAVLLLLARRDLGARALVPRHGCTRPRRPVPSSRLAFGPLPRGSSTRWRCSCTGGAAAGRRRSSCTAAGWSGPGVQAGQDRSWACGSPPEPRRWGRYPLRGARAARSRAAATNCGVTSTQSNNASRLPVRGASGKIDSGSGYDDEAGLGAEPVVAAVYPHGPHARRRPPVGDVGPGAGRGAGWPAGGAPAGRRAATA